MGPWTEALFETRSTVWTCSKPNLKSVCLTMGLQSECLMKATGKAGVLVCQWRLGTGKIECRSDPFRRKRFLFAGLYGSRTSPCNKISSIRTIIRCRLFKMSF